MWFDRLRKRIILEENKLKGKLAEDFAAMQLVLEGMKLEEFTKVRTSKQ